MMITKYTSLEGEVYLCKQDLEGSISREWRKKRISDGYDYYNIMNDAIYIPKETVLKILPIIQKEVIGMKDCKRLFDKFRGGVYEEFGGRIFSLSFDDSLSYSSEIIEISKFTNLFGFEDVF